MCYLNAVDPCCVRDEFLIRTVELGMAGGSRSAVEVTQAEAV